MVTSPADGERFTVMSLIPISGAGSERHPEGVVAVLDRQITENPKDLIGQGVIVENGGQALQRLTVGNAKDHVLATSLFFEGKDSGDVPVGSQIRFANPDG